MRVLPTKVLGIIPARAGSKGLPFKNLLELGGVSLIGRAILSTHATGLDRVVVSTDDPMIHAQAVEYGVEVIDRPSTLAQDTSGMVPVLQHAVHLLEAREEHHDLIVCLQPTSPFRTGDDIDQTVALVRDTDADSAQTLVEAHYRPWQMVHLSGHRCLPLYPDLAGADLRRQDPPGVYQPSGSVYVTRRDVLMEQGRIVGANHLGLVCPWERSLNINTLWDFRIAAMVLASGYVA